MRKFIVDATGEGQRADVFIAGKFDGYSRSSLSQLFDKGLVKRGAEPIKAGHKLRLSDKLEVDDNLIKNSPETVVIPVIYEDEDVVVINKPSGILTHSKGALNLEPTVATFLKTKINDSSLSGNRAGIVHRLDRATSGVIIGAKNSKTLKYLQKQFSNRKVKKTYLAIVEGVPVPKEAMIDVPLARNPKKPQTFIANSEGRTAKTRYKLIKTINKSGEFSVLQLQPETGRTHQIRVHMAYIGHPVVGDNIYGKDGGDMLLHAKELELNLPSGERKRFLVAAPSKFTKFDKS